MNTETETTVITEATQCRNSKCADRRNCKRFLDFLTTSAETSKEVGYQTFNDVDCSHFIKGSLIKK
jgi:hypothetical protein